MVLLISYSKLREGIEMDNAKKFIELLEGGKIRKHILPNTAPDYSAVQEKKDLENYRFFCKQLCIRRDYEV